MVCIVINCQIVIMLTNFLATSDGIVGLLHITLPAWIKAPGLDQEYYTPSLDSSLSTFCTNVHEIELLI